jgi:hypothetical protein
LSAGNKLESFASKKLKTGDLVLCLGVDFGVDLVADFGVDVAEGFDSGVDLTDCFGLNLAADFGVDLSSGVKEEETEETTLVTLLMI